MIALEPSIVLLAGSRMDVRPGSDGPGIIAFFIIAALVVVCYFLYRSLLKHLRRINVDPPAASGGQPVGSGSAGSEPT